MPRPLIRAAPALFILIWASGYVVAKYAAPHAEPLSFLVLRFLGVAMLMGTLATIARSRWPAPRACLHLAVAGLAIQAGYLGGVWVAIAQGMPAGVASLIVNLQPVLTAALAPLIAERVSRGQWIGIALGFVGVVAVVWQKLALSGGLLAWPTTLCVFALVAMTVGTLYQKRFVPVFDLRVGQTLQSTAALVVTLPLALAFESFHIDWNLPFAGALVWSVLVLTGGGVTLMFAMLREGKATTVASYLYLVPAVTALMAWAMFGETLSPLALLGMGVTLAGIWLVVKGAAPRATPR